ncbi:MAG: hypothetical protein HN793_12200 [Rhodospirillaceae bacterium]|jgi:hypothetical protein|nr:hypothetical protein [Rhodospirillaceae bacterium]MBT5239621.1 hypothetical protein [Rhodospirillaceae bacterium]MBT5564098.1 hypothetical protein [Rhodospirillaceae bacterium]MBT6089895.1 hypothetical protein [Rhodospirillaceae bacterium]MBT6962446.1 hypothetical protein [Rhodospirillaceae bacterium]
MALSLDILGFGSKRKWAFQVLDREWIALDIDIRRIDGGVRQLLFQWAQEFGDRKETLDPILIDAASFSGFLMLGPELGARPFQPSGIKVMSERLEAALDADGLTEEQDYPPVDVRIVRLILAAGLADRDIEALVDLEQQDD